MGDTMAERNFKSVEDVPNGTKCAAPRCVAVKRPDGLVGCVLEGQWHCREVHPTNTAGKLGRDPDLCRGTN